MAAAKAPVETATAGGPPKGLRFAALTRVSTERQASVGQSLITQKAQIVQCVAQLDGRLVTWYGGGAEHATEGWEKKEIDRLLRDAHKQPRPFDAVIVADIDRWSRDNRASQDGLRVFRDKGIEFFVGTTRYDLFDPTACLYLGMSAQIGAYHAANQKKKSLLNRIGRAKEGRPAVGRLPWGRTYDDRTGWGVDLDKKALIEKAAKRYLKGDAMPKIAVESGLKHCQLHKILTRRSGPTWIQSFEDVSVGIKKIEVETPVPPLLPPATIKAIHERTAANRTFYREAPKNFYLLGHLVFCASCGMALCGQTNARQVRYYRHACRDRSPCLAPWAWCRASVLEDLVVKHLWDAFGNTAAIEAAVKAALPDADGLEDNRARVEELRKLIAREEQKQVRIIEAFGEAGSQSKAVADKVLAKSQQQAEQYQTELDHLNAELEHNPSAAAIRDVAAQVSAAFKRPRVSKATVRANARMGRFESMTPTEQLDLVRKVFNGKSPDGKRLGVYVEWLPKQRGIRSRPFKYTIRGNLIEVTATSTTEVAVDPRNEPVSQYASHCRAAVLPESRCGGGFPRPAR